MCIRDRVLEEFQELIDPKSGNPLMDRTTLIANTSNMPVAAREASLLSVSYTHLNITPYIQINPYKETLKQAEDFTALLPEEKRTTTKRLSLEDAINLSLIHI